MSTELDSRLWYNDNLNSCEEFKKIIISISDNNICSNDWNNLRILDSRPGDKVFGFRDSLSKEEIFEIITNYNSEQYKFSVDVPISCWRFYNNEIKREHVVMVVSCWGKEYGTSFGLDSRIEGNAQISILNAGPFYEVIGIQNEKVSNINKHVEENVEGYIQLILQLCDNVKPKRLMTFDDLGQYLICNAHIAYYQNKIEIKNDLDFFYHLLSKGNESYKIQPLDKLNESEGNFLFNEGRSEEQRKELKKEILNAINAYQKNLITETTIAKVLEEGKYDYFDKGESILILDYPFFMNTFLDRFYLDIIRNT